MDVLAASIDMPSTLYKKQQKQRVEFVDIAKGIAIVAMVMGHTYRGGDLKLFIYAFHIPLFFFISGLFFNPHKFESVKAFFLHKAKTLLLPYVTFYLISYLYWAFVERHMRANSLAVNVFTPIVGLFYGTDYKEYMVPNGALWFLTCLFSAETLLYILCNIFRKQLYQVLCVLVFAVIGYVISIVSFPKLPLSINASFFAIFFIYLGYMLKDTLKFISQLNRFLLFFIGVVLLIIMKVMANFNGMIDMDYCKYHNPVIFVFAAMLGIYGMMLLCKFFNKSSLLSFLGANTLIILGLSEPIKRAIIGVFSKIINISIDEIRQSVLYSLGIVIIVLLVLLPIIYMFNNYLYKLMGKTKPLVS